MTGHVTKDYDLIIVGAGLVGSSLLLALKKSGLNIALVEAKENTTYIKSTLDQRSLVLSLASKLFYEQLGVWSAIEKSTTQINKIVISEQGRFSKIFLDKSSLGVDALGYVINISLLNQTIWNSINSVHNANNSIDVLCPVKLITLEQINNKVTIGIEQDNKIKFISANMLVAADGGRSLVRDLLNISHQAHNYHQTALIANVKHELVNNNIAYERFSEQGPFALLPGLDPNISGIVWPWPISKIDKIKNLSDSDLLEKLQQLFGYKLGRFVSIGECQWFPLWRITSQELSKGRVILLGNAANNLHPVGGQGFNLGLRDVKYFSKILLNHQLNYTTQIDCIFNEYKKSRLGDHYNLQHGTHQLLNLFSSHNAVKKTCRNFGMTLINHSLVLRNVIADYSMGLNA